MSHQAYIEKLLDKHGISRHENGNKTHFILSKCPVCGGEDKLYIDKNLGKFICWKCEGTGNHTKGGIVALTMLLSDIDHHAASEAIFGHRRYAKNLKNIDPFSLEFIESVRKDFTEKKPEHSGEDCYSLSAIKLPHGSVKITPGSPGYNYLANRGIPTDSLSTLVAYEIQVKSQEEVNTLTKGLTKEQAKEVYTHSLRVIFPQMVRHKMVGFVSRDYSKKRPEKYKALNSPGSWRRLCLWNFDHAKHGNRIILCEGIISAIMCGPEAVASYGNMVSDEQIALLKSSSAKEIVIMAEVGAYEAAENVALKLNSFVKVKIHYLPEVKNHDGKWKDCADYTVESNLKSADEAQEINILSLTLKEKAREDKNRLKKKNGKYRPRNNRRTLNKLLKAF